MRAVDIDNHRGHDRHGGVQCYSYCDVFRNRHRFVCDVGDGKRYVRTRGAWVEVAEQETDIVAITTEEINELI